MVRNTHNAAPRLPCITSMMTMSMTVTVIATVRAIMTLPKATVFPAHPAKLFTTIIVALGAAILLSANIVRCSYFDYYNHGRGVNKKREFEYEVTM